MVCKTLQRYRLSNTNPLKLGVDSYAEIVVPLSGIHYWIHCILNICHFQRGRCWNKKHQNVKHLSFIIASFLCNCSWLHVKYTIMFLIKKNHDFVSFSLRNKDQLSTNVFRNGERSILLLHSGFTALL